MSLHTRPSCKPAQEEVIHRKIKAESRGYRVKGMGGEHQGECHGLTSRERVRSRREVSWKTKDLKTVYGGRYEMEERQKRGDQLEDRRRQSIQSSRERDS